VYVSANNEIEDFGTADWKGRPLDVVVTDLQHRNPSSRFRKGQP
jgi:hypothetical protein